MIDIRHKPEASCCNASRNGIPNYLKENFPEQNPKIYDSSLKEAVFKDKMVYLSGGEFLMGTDDRDGFSADKEGPIRKVRVKPFDIDRTAVSNEDFQMFADETGQVTDAEKYG